MKLSHNYLDDLNPIQRQAVTETEGPVLIIAGPGSGKTRVLTYRIAHLLQKDSPAKPRDILALTFTNKAAREMKERISKVVGEAALNVWAGTFHSIFARLMRAEADLIGFQSSFTIYDSDDSKSLVDSIIKELALDKKVYVPGSVRARISSMKNNLVTPKAYKSNNEFIEEDRMRRQPVFSQIYEQYVSRCKKANAMDFDDLLYQLYNLLQTKENNLKDLIRSENVGFSPDNIEKIFLETLKANDSFRRYRFKYILVDEFQDTNFLQYSLLKKLIRYQDTLTSNLAVVGDDAQSIYAFRGATIDNILGFERDFSDHKIFKLEQNYRSTQHIVAAANDVITYNEKQIKKEIWTDKQDGQKIKVIRTLTDADEGKRVVDMLLEQKNRFHIPNSEIAILYRTNAQSRLFEENLRRYNIAYKIFGGQSFYNRKEVKDFISYLRVIVNPNDEEALKRIINYPTRGIGASTVDKAIAASQVSGDALWDIFCTADFGNRGNISIKAFVEMIKDFQKKMERTNAYEVALYAVAKSGLMAELKGDGTQEGLSRVENLNAVLDAIKAFVDSDEYFEDESSNDRSLATYLQQVSLQTDADNDDSETKEYVTLMSVHAAKGLEFDAVFVAGLEENLFPSIMAMDDPKDIDEERRLFYVAITRARKFLTLTFAHGRYRFGQMKYNEPSRFLSEISKSNVEAITLGMKDGFSTQRPPQRISNGLGNFVVPKTKGSTVSTGVVDKDFIVASSESILVGMNVLHQKFGKGEVKAIDGSRDNRVATIQFDGLTDSPSRKIMLKFAKLMIVE
jgi:DNA helicase II / ATP-dependent DNA helicase PcrA